VKSNAEDIGCYSSGDNIGERKNESKAVVQMVRLAEGFRPGDYFYKEIGLAKAHIMQILFAYPNVPDKLKTLLQKAYDQLGEAKDFMDGCDVTVVQGKK